MGAEVCKCGHAEADHIWDELWDAANCCSCPACNHYAPDYEQHQNEPCVLKVLIERIIAAGVAAERAAHAGVRAAVRGAANAAAHEARLARFDARTSQAARLSQIADDLRDALAAGVRGE